MKFKQPSKYYKVDCYLLEKIDHSKDLPHERKEKLLQASGNCFLVPTSLPGGMKKPKRLCGYCCFRVIQLLDERARMIRDRVIRTNELEHDHTAFIQLLPNEELKEYARELSDLGVNFNEAIGECARCKSFGGESIKRDFDKAQKMTNVVRHEV